METPQYTRVPSLDLADFTQGSPEQKAQFVKDLGNAFTEIGFVALKNHGLSDELVAKLYENVQAFFALPEAQKQAYEIEGIGGQRGYTGRGKEHAKGRSTGDLKEFYHVGQTVEDGDPIAQEYPENVFPKEIPDFEIYTLEAYRTLEASGKAVLRAIALYLDLNENYFDDKVHNGNSILRPIHYFPIENPESIPNDAVRAAAHGDINLITLLMGASAEGLQILRRDGEWIPVTALPEQVVVNVGDMLERHSNNRLRSTIHRVVNPPKEQLKTSRFSIPFFMHPRSDMRLDCLESCIDANNPKAYEAISAGEFLEERLREIGLKK